MGAMNAATGGAIHIRLRKGLDLPIAGRPADVLEEGVAVRTVALCGADFVGSRLRPVVNVGDRVRLGQPLCRDPGNPAVNFAAPGGGTVVAVHRGPRRSLQSVVIDLDGADAGPALATYPREALASLSPEAVRTALLESGLWTALRERPFGRVASADSQPRSIFVTAIDTNPLAADPGVVVRRYLEEFSDGLRVIGRLTDGSVFLCQAPGPPLGAVEGGTHRVAVFAGPHPAGLVGTHIHFVDPVNARKTVWYLDYQDVIAIGRLFRTGRICPERIVALGGPGVTRPRLIRTRWGVHLEDLLRDELEPRRWRILSGSILSGRLAEGAVGYLGRYHRQISVLPVEEPGQKDTWFPRGAGRFTAYTSFLSGRAGRRALGFTTALNGEPAPMMASGAFERFMPLDILPVPLLRALLVGDLDRAEALGCLELEEEDLALCSFLCPSKVDYGVLLRAALDHLHRRSLGSH